MLDLSRSEAQCFCAKRSVPCLMPTDDAKVKRSVKTRHPWHEPRADGCQKNAGVDGGPSGSALARAVADSPMSEAETAPLHASKRGRRGSPRPRFGVADLDPAYGGGPPGGPQG